MTITPDNLAARFAPPVTHGALYARQVAFSDGAMELAEQVLDALPRGHHLDRAVDALETAVHQVWAGLNAVYAEVVAEVVAEQGADQVPFVLDPASVPTAPPPEAGLGDLDLNVSLWRTCLRGAMDLHPFARLTAYVVAEAADSHGFIADSDQPEIESLCLATGLDVGMVLQALEDLATHGWIGRHNNGGGTTRYQLRTPASAPR